MVHRNVNPRLQGAEGVVAAIAWFSTHGYRVFIPLAGECQRYDLVVDNGDRLFRVEVKTTTSNQKSAWSVELRTSGGNKSGTGKTKRLDADEFDLLFVATPEAMYLFDAAEVAGRSSLKFGHGDKHHQRQIYQLT